MAGGGGSMQVSRDKRGKSSKRKKMKRVGFHLDMTPLVDITFLLLTFFMFTTTMAKPQIMEMKIPPEVDEDVKVKQSQLFNVWVSPGDSIFYNRGFDTPEYIELNELREIAVKLNLEPDVRNELITALKVANGANYGLVVNILDELNLAEAEIIKEFEDDIDPETGEPIKRKRKFSIAPLTDEEFTEDFNKQLEGQQ